MGKESILVILPTPEVTAQEHQHLTNLSTTRAFPQWWAEQKLFLDPCEVWLFFSPLGVEHFSTAVHTSVAWRPLLRSAFVVHAAAFLSGPQVYPLWPSSTRTFHSILLQSLLCFKNLYRPQKWTLEAEIWVRFPLTRGFPLVVHCQTFLLPYSLLSVFKAV